MALKYSLAVRNAQLDAFESTVGTTAVLKIRTLAPPASCADADVGSELAVINLPSPDWMQTATNGQKAKAGVWQVASAQGTGTAGHWRIYDGGGVCHAQGTVTAALGGGDMTLDNTNIQGGSTITINTFVIQRGNA